MLERQPRDPLVLTRVGNARTGNHFPRRVEHQCLNGSFRRVTTRNLPMESQSVGGKIGPRNQLNDLGLTRKMEDNPIPQAGGVIRTPPVGRGNAGGVARVQVAQGLKGNFKQDRPAGSNIGSAQFMFAGRHAPRAGRNLLSIDIDLRSKTRALEPQGRLGPVTRRQFDSPPIPERAWRHLAGSLRQTGNQNLILVVPLDSHLPNPIQAQFATLFHGHNGSGALR